MSRFGLLSGLVGSLLFIVVLTSGEGAASTMTNHEIRRIVIASGYDRPLLVTSDGEMLRPDGEIWRRIESDSDIRDIYVEGDTFYAATGDGVLKYREGEWQTIAGTPPVDDIEAMHGFIFAFGERGTARGTETWRILNIPQPEKPASGFVMLGNHSHILLNGGLYVTHDMGLSWEMLDAPAELNRIAVDEDGHLLAATVNSLYRWNYREKSWAELAVLPFSVEAIQAFQREIYILSDGALFRLEKGEWTKISGFSSAYLTAMNVQYPDTLWVADSAGQMLWSTHDAQRWQALSIKTP
jgi:hypothetical protein